jgi:DNA mismatch endonuclease, patch repair protein
MTPSFAASRISTRRNTAGSKHRFDSLSREARSGLMRRVRQQHTGPELIVRSLLHRLGLRFTVTGPLNASLPSRPDIVLPRWKTVILVHGCFWHRHTDCKLATTPTTRAEFWSHKFAANVLRDHRQRGLLRKNGWRVLTIWECETRLPQRLSLKLTRFFQLEGR